MTTAALTMPLPAPRSTPALAGVQWSFWLAAAILVFNLLDGIMTLAVVHAGLASEANPLMATSLSWGGVPFMLVKTGLVSMGVYVLYLRRERLLGRAALVGLTAVYVAIIAYHANSVDALVRHAA